MDPDTAFILGIFCIIITTLLLVIYIIALRAIAIEPELFNLSSYKLMFWLGIFDISDSFFINYFGKGLTLLVPSSYNPVIMKIAGACCEFLWFMIVPLTAVISFNRFLVVWFPYPSKLCFGGRRVYFWLGGILFIGILHFAVFISPGNDYLFVIADGRWKFVQTAPLIQVYLNVMNVAPVVVIFVLHVLILARLKQLHSHVFTTKIKSISGETLAIAAPMATGAVLIFNYFYFMLTPYFWSGTVAVILADIVGILATSVNGLLYILFNRTVRAAVVKMLRGVGDGAEKRHDLQRNNKVQPSTTTGSKMIQSRQTTTLTGSVSVQNLDECNVNPMGTTVEKPAQPTSNAP